MIFAFSSDMGMSIFDQHISKVDFMNQSAAIPPDKEKGPDFFSAHVTEARRFHLNMNPPSSTSLAVVCGGFEHCIPSYAIRRRTLAFCGVEYVTSGNGTVKFAGREHRLQPGSVFSYGPRIAHDILTDQQRTLGKYFVDFTGTRAQRLLASCNLRPGTVVEVFPPLDIQPLFDEIIRIGRQGTPQAHLVCARLLEAVLIKATESSLVAAGRESLAFGTYQRCRDHIQRNFLRLHSLEELAVECQVDDAYVCRLFQKFDHQTPSRRLLALKMNYAAERLRSPGVLVKQVAEEIGFANQFHFSRSFKSIFGVSPRALTKMR